MNVQNIAIDQLHAYARNAKQHPKEQIDKIAQQISTVGFLVPIVVDKDYVIIAGHGRFLAAKALGWTEVPVVVADHLTEDQAMAWRIADNKVAESPWDMPMLAFDLKTLEMHGFDLALTTIPMEEIQSLFADHLPEEMQSSSITPENQDVIPEKVESRTKLGNIYQLGRHRLMCGDSTKIADIEKLMDGNKIDLWITDPPYGVDYVAKNAAVHGGVVHNAVGKEIKNDTQTPEELKPFWHDVASNVSTVMNEVCAMYWFGASSAMMMMMMIALDEAGWNNRHTLIWVKQSMVFGRSDYHYQHEPIIYGWKKDGTHEWYGDRKQVSVFNVDRPHRSDLHPTTKPVELIERLVLNSSKAEQSILDTFCGSGTTLIAAEKLNRRCFAMELDPHYCDVIVTRWEMATGQKAELISA